MPRPPRTNLPSSPPCHSASSVTRARSPPAKSPQAPLQAHRSDRNAPLGLAPPTQKPRFSPSLRRSLGCKYLLFLLLFFALGSPLCSPSSRPRVLGRAARFSTFSPPDSGRFPLPSSRPAAWSTRWRIKSNLLLPRRSLSCCRHSQPRTQAPSSFARCLLRVRVVLDHDRLSSPRPLSALPTSPSSHSRLTVDIANHFPRSCLPIAFAQSLRWQFGPTT